MPQWSVATICSISKCSTTPNIQVAKLTLKTLIAQYPSLKWTTPDGTQIEFIPYDQSIDEQLATHAYAVPFINASSCLVTRRGDGRWTLPGGSAEENETWDTTLHRELLEETGCSIIRSTAFGAYRVSIDHNTSYRIVCHADVEKVQAPADPDGPRGIVEVRALPPAQAAKLFTDDCAHFRPIYLIAQELRAQGFGPFAIEDPPWAIDR